MASADTGQMITAIYVPSLQLIEGIIAGALYML